MKKFLLIHLVLIFSANLLLGQSVNEYKKKIDSLNMILEEVELKISKLNGRKNEIHRLLYSIIQKKNKLELENRLIKGIPITINALGGILWDEPDIHGNELIKIPVGDTVLIYDWYKRPFFKASYHGKIGYITYAFLNINRELKSIIDKDLQENNPELERLTKIYGSYAANRILRKEYWIGMTDNMAMESLGYPDDINRSIGAWGTNEQWIYSKKNLYLYFENGKLTSIQE